MSDRALADWLDSLEHRSPASRIDLGLDRVRRVWRRLDIDLSNRAIITVAGTNGKGSVVAMCEAMTIAAGLKPFAYSSPHLIEFAERMRLGGHNADAAAIVHALEAVEEARGNESLTYFEHITLSGLVLAVQSDADVLILEVGLGGRLDAVNIVDADVAIITSVGLDHTDLLGRTRAVIAREKAGIARAGRPVIVGEKRLPNGLLDELDRIGAQVILAGRDFAWRLRGDRLMLQAFGRTMVLPLPGLPGKWQLANAACAVLAIQSLYPRLTVPEAAIASGLASARLPGRFQRFSGSPDIIADVAHNGPAARALAAALGRHEAGSTAVFSALEGKNVAAIGKALDPCFSHWLVAGMEGNRGRSADAIAAELDHIPVAGVLETVESIPAALRLALERAGPQERIVVFGSFRTVAEAWPTLIKHR